MAATSMSRVLVPGAVVAAAVLAFAVYQQGRREPTHDTKAVIAAPKAAQSSPPDSQASALAAAQSTANALAGAVTGAPAPPDSADGLPAFDVARIEPSGDAVIAGRASPGATVELLHNGEVFDRAVADASGQFVMVPPRLPSGTYDLSLRATQPDGKPATSKQSVAVVLEASPKDKPVVALMTPDKPTVVLSQPTAGKAAPGSVIVQAVDPGPGDKLHVSGRARPGATLRLYLNDSLVAGVTASADGRFAVTIKEGVAPGSYRIRVDEVERKSGAVHARAEVPFNVPQPVVTASAPPQGAKRVDVDAAQQPQLAAAGSVPEEGSPGTVVVPKIATTTVARGDNLWRLSRTTYGEGTRYAVIYKANREQIRNPNLIYPGQIFVLPSQ